MRSAPPYPRFCFVVHHPHLRIGARQLVENLRGRVRAAVVDDDDFEIRGQARGGLERSDDQTGDRPTVVVGRQKDTQPRLFGLRRAHQEAVNLSNCWT